MAVDRCECLLGIGSGLIIPLSTGLISKYFVGTYRVKQFGLSSAITNFTLVIATAVTGYLAEVSWHLPFLVYLLPLISILLVGHLKESRSDAAVKPSSQSTAPSGQTAAVDTEEVNMNPYQASASDHAFLRSDDFYCAGSHIQPFFPDGETPFLQWQFGTDDLAFLFSDYGSGFLSGQDSG